MKPWTWRGALLAPGNVAGAVAAALGAAWVPHPAPLLAWLAVEGVYLGLGAWRSARESAQRPLPAVPASWERLAPSQREQYRALRELSARVEENLSALPGGRALEAVSQPRLDALLDEFARLLHTLNQHREFLATADPDGTRAERDGVAQELAPASTETDAALREVKQRRLEILEQRLARIAQVRSSREVVAHELAAIEDLVRLAYEQSVAVRDPAQASEALAALAEQARAAEETVRELERFRDLGLPARWR